MLVYYVPHVQALGGSPQAAELGRRWLAEHAREGIPFILTPTTRQASSNDVIRALTSSGVRWSIPRNFPPHDWPGGPVLAPWSDDKVLECIDRWSERISSVCVLKWVEDSCRDWLTARGARDVTAPASEPLVPGIRLGRGPLRVDQQRRGVRRDLLRLGEDILHGLLARFAGDDLPRQGEHQVVAIVPVGGSRSAATRSTSACSLG